MANPLRAMLQDVRKMRRSITLRGEEDPEKVTRVLEVILNEAIALKTSGFDTLGKGAVNELRNIRRALVSGQIDAGNNTANMIGTFSHILDTIDKTDTETQKTLKERGGDEIGTSIIRHMPSADTIAAAMITANPMMGYVTKIGLDFVRSRKEARLRAKQEQQAKLANLKLEREKLEESKSEKAEVSEEQSQPLERIDFGLVDIKDELVIRLDSIKDKLEELNDIWRSPSKQEEALNSIIENSEDTNNSLERIIDVDTQQLETAERQEQKESLLERERSVEGGSFTAGSVSALREQNSEEESQINSMLTGLWAAFGGAIGGGAAALLSPFKKLFGFLIKGGKILAPFAKGTIVIGAIMSIFDFVDGFSNAAEILDREEGSITVVDRIRAGIASIVTSLISSVDALLDFVGLGFMDESDENSMTKKMVEWSEQFTDWLLSPLTIVKDYIDEQGGLENIWERVKEAASLDNIIAFLRKPVDAIDNYIDNFSFDEMIEPVTNYFSNTIDSIIGTIKKQFSAVNDYITELDIPGKVEQAKSYVGSSIDSAFNFIKSPFLAVANYIDSFSLEDTLQTVYDGIDETINSISSKFTEMTDAIGEWVESQINALKESWLGKGVSSVINWVTGDGEKNVELEGTAIVGPEVPDVPPGGLKLQIEEPQTNNSSLLSGALDSITDWLGFGDKPSSGNTVIAPTSNTSINNQTIVEGSSGARHNDNTWRRTNDRNLSFQ